MVRRDRAGGPKATDAEGAHRVRDASRTQEALLKAARERFARQGYGATTVRQIAEDAGVNVALINRYFGSKEGLFEACLADAVAAMKRAAGSVEGQPDIARIIARQIAGTYAEPEPDLIPLVLLLRTSGDPAAERLRLGLLQTFSERLADAAGGSRKGRNQDVLLRAQVVLATTLGLALVRLWPEGLRPLATATEEELAQPLAELVDAMLGH